MFQSGKLTEAPVPANQRYFSLAFNVLCVFFIAVFLYLSYNAHKYNKMPTKLTSIKVFKAEMAPYRIKPDNRGGEVFKNQDRLIYNNIIEKKAPRKIAPKEIKKAKKVKKKDSNNIFNKVLGD